MSDNGNGGFKVVYTIVERGEGKKPMFVRVGAAFPNRDGSLNVKLDALPTNGTLHIRDHEPWDESRRGGAKKEG